MAAGVSEYIERVETDGGEVESDIYVSESVEGLGDFFDDASLVNIPTAYKATKLYSIKPTDGSGDFTFSRSTTGTRINESGFIEKNIGVNVPRINYLSGVPSLLLEPQRTNLINYSEDFSTYTISPNTTLDFGYLSPTNSNDAYTVKHDGTTAEYYLFKNVSIPSAAITVSVFIKKGTKNWIALRVGNIIIQYFDVENKVLGGYVFSQPLSYSFEDYANDWVRVSMTINGNGSSANASLYVAQSSSSVQVTGNAGDELIYAYGFQIEEGSYATSYIPTNGTTVTRTIDAITNSVSYALSNGYTIFIELQTQSLTVSNDIEFKDASSNYVFRVGDEVIVGAGLFTQANTTGYNKFALQVDASGNYELFKNGSSVTSGSGIAHDIEVISSVAGQDVRQILVFEQTLTDAECITLTTI